MTVTAAFDKNSGQLRPDIPVCTARVFREVIEPLAERLHLPLITGWDTMVEIDSKNYTEFIQQITVFMSELTSSGSDPDDIDLVKDRLTRLTESMADAFGSGADILVTIG
jgi:hypothetical protein